MNYNPVTIISGLMLLFGISYLLISVYSYLYVKFATKSNIDKRKFWLAVAIVTLAWVVATILSVMFASGAGFLLFAVVSMILIFAVNYFLVEKTLGITGKHKIFYSLALSVIINPVWYFLLG